jgi:hypothetical protein
LREEARQNFQLDVLRLPIFEQLGKALRQANESGKPYHILHFDGHGTYVEGPDRPAINLSAILFKGLQAGSHGYPLFEEPDREDNAELVDGVRLGNLLVETNTPVLVLNACRSAHPETAVETRRTEEGEAPAGGPAPAIMLRRPCATMRNSARPRPRRPSKHGICW